jgi:7-keto-8-aminopelargonate synthetase-like enzyme
LSKAFGGFGGIIPGCSEFINRIRTGHIMTGSSPSIHAASAASLKGIELVMKHPEMRERLWSNARLLKKGLNSIGLEVGNSYFPMSAFSVGNSEKMKKIHCELLKKDIFIQLSNYMGESAEKFLRIVVFSTHTSEQIAYLTDTLKKLL